MGTGSARYYQLECPLAGCIPIYNMNLHVLDIHRPMVNLSLADILEIIFFLLLFDMTVSQISGGTV